MSKLEKYYGYLPEWMQNLAVSWAGWRIQRRRFDARFEQYLADYKLRSLWDHERIEQYRDRRLREFVKLAQMQTAFYKELYGLQGEELKDIRTIEDLQSLPIIGKQEAQAAHEALTNRQLSEDDYAIQHTSGSTGAGLKFPATHDSHREQWAVWWRYRNWHGIERSEECLYFGGRSVVPLEQTSAPYWRYNWPGKQILFSGYHLGPETARLYLDEMQRSGLRWIHGYPSLLSLLGQYAIEQKAKLNIRWVTIGAESLLENQKAIIREAFGVEPLQHYGMAEGVANISQCPQGALHVDEDFSAVEFVPTETQGCCRVVGTGFTNPAFPLIRYDVGDLVTLGDKKCDCGRPGRVVEQIDGRQEDFIILKNGARLGRLDHIFKDCVHVKEAQIVQEEVGQMTVKVVRGDEFQETDEEQLRQEIQQRVGDFLDYEIQYVDQIERTARGKLRFVISKVKSA